ncbi:MAG TPA: AraC family transcriptional regulator [Rhodothermales bacterium]|nr:AraC family transcriptional regulator [Rhodothermales bacterium]
MTNAYPISPSRRDLRSSPVGFEGQLTDLLEALGIPCTPAREFGPMAARCEAGRDRAPAGRSTRDAVELVKGFVEVHAGDALDLERLAETAGVSKFHLVRLFRESEGTTPWAYVRALRLRKAKELLESDLPLVDVALQAGYYDQSHLNRAFREAEGKTPGQYREERKNLQD